MKNFFAVLGWLFTITLYISACYGSDVTKPAEGKGTSYPCGVWGVECRTGGCCPWAHICGDSVGNGRFNRCEDGYCCQDGDPLYGSSADGGMDSGTRNVVKQRRPQ